jgi:signal peptidase I
VFSVTVGPVLDEPATEPATRAEDAVAPLGRASRQASRAHRIREWILIVVAAVSVALIVRATVVQAFFIPSESMVPTLKVHDRLLVDKVSYRVHDIRRGDIVVFRRPPAETDPTVKDLIKRVIGLPSRISRKAP